MLTDHIAILLYSSLDQARTNRLNPNKPAAFFAQIAFPPTAGSDLHQLVSSVAPGGQLAGLEIGVNQASTLKKPIPGIPGDWLVVRASTQFAPTILNTQGQAVTGSEAIRATFYPGRRIRGALSVFPWNHPTTGRKGVSFNLQGVMDAGPGERLAIGDGVTVNAFQAYAQSGGGQATAGATNPFGGVAPSPTPASTATNPFASAGSGGSVGAGAQNNNPFAQ